MEHSRNGRPAVSAELAGQHTASSIEPRRLRRAKAAYTTRFVARSIARDIAGYGVLSGTDVVPRPGDVVMAQVQTIGQHKAIELPDGRRATLFEGDDVDRRVRKPLCTRPVRGRGPGDLGPTSLVAAGGVAAQRPVEARVGGRGHHAAPGGPADRRQGSRDPAAPRAVPVRWPEHGPQPDARPFTIGVVGTSMNSGKTTTVASIVRGLTSAGLDVAAGKVTGTGAGGDPGLFQDSGAARVLDFTDFGLASTYLLRLGELRALLAALHRELCSDRPDAVVLEVADGLLQSETARAGVRPRLRPVRRLRRVHLHGRRWERWPVRRCCGSTGSRSPPSAAC